LTGADRGFLLLTGHLGDPERRPLTVAQFRELTRQARRMERPLSDRELTEDDIKKISDTYKAFRKAGDYFDAHHIQSLKLGGTNDASNITPLDYHKHQEIHSKTGSCTRKTIRFV